MKGYGFLSFAKNMGKNISKSTSKSLSGKYSQKILDHAKTSATDALKTSSMKLILKLQGFQKIKNNNLETVTNEHDKGISKERYTSLEERQEIIDDLSLK